MIATFLMGTVFASAPTATLRRVLRNGVGVCTNADVHAMPTAAVTSLRTMWSATTHSKVESPFSETRHLFKLNINYMTTIPKYSFVCEFKSHFFWREDPTRTSSSSSTLAPFVRLMAASMALTPKTSHDFASARLDKVFIGISGLIGAGKSTLAKSLAERLELPVYFEPVSDNEYLGDFYKDIKKYSFAMQVCLQRFHDPQTL